MLHCPGIFVYRSPSLPCAQNGHLKLWGSYSAKQLFNTQTLWHQAFVDAGYSHPTMLPSPHLERNEFIFFSQKVYKTVSVGHPGIAQLPCFPRGLISAKKERAGDDCKAFGQQNHSKSLCAYIWRALKSRRTHKMQFGLCKVSRMNHKTNSGSILFIQIYPRTSNSNVTPWNVIKWWRFHTEITKERNFFLARL